MNYDLKLGQAQGDTLRPAWADLTGLIASIGCALHCAAMPIIIGYLPALGLGWIATQGFHQAMAVICSLIAIAAFIPGWRKHRKYLPALLGLVGITLLTSHAFGANDCCEEAACSEPACVECVECETSSTAPAALSPDVTAVNSAPTASSGFWSRLSWFVTPLGGCFLVCAHLVNHRFACGCCRGEQPCDSILQE